MAPKSKNRRAFNFSRDNLWSIDPFEIGIIGGHCLPKEEQGPHDTEVDKKHDLWDKRLLTPLTEEFVASVTTRGVLVPVLIVKIGDHPYVVAGRRRVRAARRANIARKKAGEPLLMVSCKMRRVTSAIGAQEGVIENEHRLDDDVPTKIEKAPGYINKGTPEETVAEMFNVGVNVIRGWMLYQDTATNEVKAAVNAGRLSAHAAATLAKVAEPEEQRAKLAELITSGEKITGHKIQTAAKIARGEATGVTDKKTQKRLLQVVQEWPGSNSEKTMAFREGAEEMLKLILGEVDVDSRLSGKLDEARGLMKSEKREKEKAKTKKQAEKIVSDTADDAEAEALSEEE